MRQTRTARLVVALVLVQALVAGTPVYIRAQIGSCPVFPANNVWNMPVTTLPVDSHSDAYIASIGTSVHLHPDFGAGLYNGEPIGIPYTAVPPGQPRVSITFVAYGDQSDPGPYPIPPGAPIEGGPTSTGDRHVLVADQGTCKLYELDAAYPNTDGSWNADSGAVFDLTGNALRPATWTSADAAGLPILPGLVRHDEVASGAINHALRFTVQHTQNAFIWPARHEASTSMNPGVPPMGQRFRLKASVNTAAFSHDTQTILTALKTYGMFVADNGSNWYLSGAPDNGWNNDQLVAELGSISGSDFEAVDESALQVAPDSAESRPLLGTLDPPFGVISGGTTVTITGTGFVPGVQVAFGGAAASVAAVNATAITVKTAAHPTGIVDLTVTNPSGAAATLAGHFQYFAHAIGPTVNAVPRPAPVPHSGITAATGIAPNPAPMRH